jgi:hypothetical protein
MKLMPDDNFTVLTKSRHDGAPAADWREQWKRVLKAAVAEVVAQNKS